MSSFLHRPLCLRAKGVRTFTTTASKATSLQVTRLNPPDLIADTVPPYPYGPARWYKQSDRGLYGGQSIRFGNNVGPKSKTKTRRSWHPNVFRKRLFSKALGDVVQVKCTTRVLRTIDKVGGLDEYLLGGKEARVRELGLTGWWLRWAVLRTEEGRRKVLEERRRLGLPVEGVPDAEAEVIERASSEGAVAEAAEDLTEEEKEIRRQQELQEVEELQAQEEILALEEVVNRKENKSLRFRIDNGKHLYDTGNGWAQTKPDPDMLYKENMRKRSQEYMDYRNVLRRASLERLEETLKALPAKEKLSAKEESALRMKLLSKASHQAELYLDEMLRKWQERREELFAARCEKLRAKGGDLSQEELHVLKVETARRKRRQEEEER